MRSFLEPVLGRLPWIDAVVIVFGIGMFAPSILALEDREPTLAQFIGKYCVSCHHSGSAETEVILDDAKVQAIGQHQEVWEKAVKKLRARQMPPSTSPRPTLEEYTSITALLERTLDENGEVHPGRTETFRRLNRVEYQNAVRDLLGVSVDIRALLPADEASYGFDNVTVSDLSPTLLLRYLTAAQRISRMAVGVPSHSPGGDTIRIPADRTQEEHVEGLPLGTRGGTRIDYHFPIDGDYEIQARLTRDRNEHVEGLSETHEIVFLLDREPIGTHKISPAKNGDHSKVDLHLSVRARVSAGEHQLGVTFIKKGSSLLETKRQPYQAQFNAHRHPRRNPALYQVSITGPLDVSLSSRSMPSVLSPSQKKIIVELPLSEKDEERTAEANLRRLMKLAYRRPIVPDDLIKPMTFFREGRREGGYLVGMEGAIASILTNPKFLFRVEREPESTPSGVRYPIDELELATRLSFFLWSSIPDEELLDLAIRKELRRDQNLAKQVDRMLADPKASMLVDNFAEQWLYLRNLDSFTPDLRMFPDFDDNLREAFRQETKLLVATVLRENRPATELIQSNYTFLNERLAKHYGIPNIYGNRMRRIEFSDQRQRGGLLRHGSILTVTSYANRTSPVLRGHWILKNLLGTAPPPPPPNVPTLQDNTVSANLSIRDRLMEHRANPACASCHDIMDPIGFTLENYDAIGRFRERDGSLPVDAKGRSLDGEVIEGVEGWNR